MSTAGAQRGRGPITLLTDFGTRDGYAAALHGAILAIAPAAAIHDATHDIAPGDIASAVACLQRYWLLFPAGSIHVVVVDPGVGSEREPLLVTAADRFLIGPDNGVLTPALRTAGARVFTLAEPRFMRASVSATFHGRDIFAPAAAHLLMGVASDAFGPERRDAVRLEELQAQWREGALHGMVTAIDRFGNLITNVRAEAVPTGARVRVGGLSGIPWRRTYADARVDEVLALAGSDGWLEVAVRDGNAAAVLGVGRGAAVVVRPADAPSSS